MTKAQIATSFASAAAALFIAGCSKNADTATAQPTADADGSAKVKCMGINECKGQGACDTATHDCAGKNECAGKGWIQVTRDECSDKGGTEV